MLERRKIKSEVKVKQEVNAKRLKGKKKTNLTGEQFIEAGLGTGGRR